MRRSHPADGIYSDRADTDTPDLSSDETSNLNATTEQLWAALGLPVPPRQSITLAAPDSLSRATTAP